MDNGRPDGPRGGDGRAIMEGREAWIPSGVGIMTLFGTFEESGETWLTDSW